MGGLKLQLYGMRLNYGFTNTITAFATLVRDFARIEGGERRFHGTAGAFGFALALPTCSVTSLFC